MEDGVIVDNMDVTEIHERLVRQAIELARRARQAGNHPFGALLALEGTVLLTAQNTITTDRDPTCAMCTGKMYWAGIRSVVYALPSEQLAALAARDFVIPCRELFSRSRETVQVVGPVLIDEAREVHLGFWP